MTYPDELIPQNNYKLIDIDEISDSSHIVRRSLVNQESTYDAIGNVRCEALINEDEERFLFGLSSNLLGIYKIEYLKFNPGKKHNNYWQLGADTNKKIQYTLYKNPFPIFFKISLIHNIPFPYETPNRKNKTISITGRCCLLHKPTCANFWHCELTFFDNCNNQIKTSNSKWKLKAAKSFIRMTLKVIAFNKSETPPEIEIPAAVYKKIL